MSAPARTLVVQPLPGVLGWRRTLAAYVALTKPRIIELLLVTTFPEMVVAADGLPRPRLTLAPLLRRATAPLRRRPPPPPPPAGLIAPDRALAFGVSLSVLSFVFLQLSVNLLTAVLAVSAILFYVFVYTLWLKRTTVENIVIGGAAGAVPPLCGWAAVTGSLDAAPLLMFAVIFLWTPPHFWALAINYTSDYAQAGVPMLPVTHALEARRRSLVYALVTVATSLALYATDAVGLVYLAIAAESGLAFIWLAWRQINLGTGRAALSLFRFSTSDLALSVVAFGVGAPLLYGGATLVAQNKPAAPAGEESTAPAGPVSVTIVAKDLKFDKGAITASAGSDVTG